VCRLHGVYRLCRPSASSSLSLPPWEPAMAMRRCEMKKVFGIYNNPDRALRRLWLPGPTVIPFA
jgi:hypothetical protein